MKVIFVTDLHGDRNKYNRLRDIVVFEKPSIVINGGDILPYAEKNIDMQKMFIVKDLDAHLQYFEKNKINYLFQPGNEDLKIFDELYEKYDKTFKYVKCTMNKVTSIGDYEFIGFDIIVM
jgi:Icc-related predicted phosphoesterase